MNHKCASHHHFSNAIHHSAYKLFLFLLFLTICKQDTLSVYTSKHR